MIAWKQHPGEVPAALALTGGSPNTHQRRPFRHSSNRSRQVRTVCLAALALAALGAPVVPADLNAQGQPATTVSQATTPAVTQELLRDMRGVERKLIGLGEAMPEDKFGWRPMAGARSVSEVLMHVAAANYYMPSAAGIAAPTATGVTTDYATAEAFERRTVTRAEALQLLRESFAHLRTAVAGTDEAFLKKTINAFGGSGSGLSWWVMTTTHLHEHLGQLIAYARSNGVVPPWSS
jgi:hypothetical protein